MSLAYYLEILGELNPLSDIWKAEQESKHTIVWTILKLDLVDTYNKMYSAHIYFSYGQYIAQELALILFFSP